MTRLRIDYPFPILLFLVVVLEIFSIGEETIEDEDEGRLRCLHYIFSGL